MEDVQHCCVCLELYSKNRVPTRLGCNHTVCRLCLSTQAISACPLCRSHVGPLSDLPADTLLLSSISKANNMPLSPTSFPIGLLADEGQGVDDAPGTPPYPSAPALVEIQPCLTDDEGPSRRVTASGSSLPRSSGGSSVDLPHQPSSSRLSQQQGGMCAEASRAASGSSTLSPTNGPAAVVTERALITHNNSNHTAPPQRSKGWRSRLPFSPRSNSPASSAAGSIPRHVSGQGLSSAASTGSQQQVLLSFPVDDLDPYQDELGLQDSLPGSPRSWPMQDEGSADIDDPAAAAGAGTSRRAGAADSSRSRSRDKQGGGSRRRICGVYASTHAAVQALVGGAAGLLQQLAVPWGGLLDHEGCRPGWPAAGALPHTSVVVATVHSSIYCWASYTTTLQRSLKACKAAQVHTENAMEGLCRRVGMSGYGQLAWWWVATWLLGFLLYHWQLGLQLLPIAAASLALSAVVGMQPLAEHSSGTSSSNGSLSRRRNARGAAEITTTTSGSSSSGSRALGGSRGSWSLPVWPSKSAGCLLAADCCALGLLLCVNQHTGLGSGPLLGLLAATPVLLAVVALLLCGQVVVDVLCRGWWGHGELRHASLLCRCWLVAAAGVLAAGGVISGSGGLSSTLAAAAAWVQKVHMLLVEGPVLVLYLSSLLQAAGVASEAAAAPAVACSHSRGNNGRLGAAASSSFGRGSSTAPPAAAGAGVGVGAPSPSRGGGAAAVLCVLHFLLQLLVLLFVPPGPLAAATWLPQHLQGLIVWGARVMLCGVAMQLVLRAVGGVPAGAAAAAAASAPAAAGAPALAGGVWGGAGRLSSSCAGQQALLGHSNSSGSGCAAGLSSCQQQQQHRGVPCCSSPSPRGRKGWELQLHAGHGGNNSSCGGSGCSSHDLWGGDAGCGSNSQSHCGSSWALAPHSSGREYGLSVGSGALGGLGVVGSGNGGSLCGSGVAAGVYRLLWQHAPYLLLLVAAFAGDTLITAAAPASAAPVALAIRLAWQRCLQCCMVAALALEVAAAARREVTLLLRLPLLAFGRGSSSGNSSGNGNIVFGVLGWQQAAAVW